MKAMILAAGKGTRLRDITKGEIPKPMVDLGEGPLLLHTVNQLVEFGVDEIIINLHHRGETVKEFFGEEWRGTPIRYSEEEELMGTAGGVRKVKERFEDKFFLIYGDILTDLDFKQFVDYHEHKGSNATALVYEETENLTESGVMLLDQENEVKRLVEKPSKKEISSLKEKDIWTNAAVLILEPSIIDLIPEGFSDFSHDILPKVIENDTLDLYAYPRREKDYWHEVGNPKRYLKAISDIDEGEIDFNSTGY